eukprot:5503992-Ditylum_brightwellii.AAC.1
MDPINQSMYKTYNATMSTLGQAHNYAQWLTRYSVFGCPCMGWPFYHVYSSDTVSTSYFTQATSTNSNAISFNHMGDKHFFIPLPDNDATKKKFLGIHIKNVITPTSSWHHIQMSGLKCLLTNEDFKDILNNEK